MKLCETTGFQQHAVVPPVYTHHPQTSSAPASIYTAAFDNPHQLSPYANPLLYDQAYAAQQPHTLQTTTATSTTTQHQHHQSMSTASMYAQSPPIPIIKPSHTRNEFLNLHASLGPKKYPGLDSVLGNGLAQWDINDPKLPKISQFDQFSLWPQGNVCLAYNKTASEQARRHVSGWAMRNTNNHNTQILKKSCLGVLLCTSTGCDLAMRPAICDKARHRQDGKACPKAGCSGRVYMRRCRGHEGYPVTHFWRECGNTVYFQSKGTHDHVRPDLKPVRDTASRRRRQQEQQQQQPPPPPEQAAQETAAPEQLVAGRKRTARLSTKPVEAAEQSPKLRKTSNPASLGYAYNDYHAYYTANFTTPAFQTSEFPAVFPATAEEVRTSNSGFLHAMEPSPPHQTTGSSLLNTINASWSTPSPPTAANSALFDQPQQPQQPQQSLEQNYSLTVVDEAAAIQGRDHSLKTPPPDTYFMMQAMNGFEMMPDAMMTHCSSSSSPRSALFSASTPVSGVQGGGSRSFHSQSIPFHLGNSLASNSSSGSSSASNHSESSRHSSSSLLQSYP